jgi:plastocyanin
MHLSRPLAALLLALLVSIPATPIGSAKGQDEDVEIVEPGDTASWSYSPTSLTVTVGTTVTWKNTGAAPHGVTSQDQLFDSRLLDNGKSWSYTFESPGTYRYFCVPHPWMKGTVVVIRDTDEPAPRQPRGSGTGSPSIVPSPTSTPTTTSGS